VSADTVRHPLRGIPLAEQTLPALLQRQAERYEERPLFRWGTTELSYRDVRELAARSAGRLAEAGVQPGDRIAAMCENRIELFELILGCAWYGAIVVPINTASRGAQLEHILGNCGARQLVVESTHLEALAQLGSHGSVELTWVLPALDASSADPVDIAGLRVGEVPAAGDPVAAHPAGPGDIAAILYTSGTTGPSKGVRCPHAQFYWWGVLMSESLRISEGDVMYTCLPLFHTNALNAFVQALVSGATFVLGERFSASRFWARMLASGADVTYLLGAMVSILMARPYEPAEREHHVRIALAPATPARMFDGFRERFGVQLVEGYGSTETNCPIAAEDPAEGRGGYMGTLRAGFHARVVDEQDEPVPDGSAGELVLRHDEPFAFADGYWAMPEQTVKAWRNLWFHTGDRVVREANGYYRFVDRLKDAIRRRGENVSSFEVEQILLSHPDVGNAAVFPVPSELAEDEIMAAIVRRPGSTLTERGLCEFCQPQLAYFAVPRFIEFVDALPVTENGKVQKFKLRDRGVTATTWDREAAGLAIKR
jgi:crotonobetaine/carnitine-CoA ligase